MSKWFKIGAIAVVAAIGVTVLALATFIYLQPNTVAAQGGGPPAAGVGQAPQDGPQMDGFNQPWGGPQMGGFNQPWGGPQMDGFGPGQGFGNFGRAGRIGRQIDFKALLAESLGITVEELETAYEEAHQAALQQAVTEGLITQEEADQLQARHQLRTDYLDRDAIIAEALGITPEELQAAYDEGKPLMVLLYELDLDPVTVRTNLRTAFEQALQQAVTDGVITQEEADQMLNGAVQRFGRRGRGSQPGFPGRGGGGLGWR